MCAACGGKHKRVSCSVLGEPRLDLGGQRATTVDLPGFNVDNGAFAAGGFAGVDDRTHSVANTVGKRVDTADARRAAFVRAGGGDGAGPAGQLAGDRVVGDPNPDSVTAVNEDVGKRTVAGDKNGDRPRQKPVHKPAFPLG